MNSAYSLSLQFSYFLSWATPYEVAVRSIPLFDTLYLRGMKLGFGNKIKKPNKGEVLCTVQEKNLGSIQI